MLVFVNSKKVEKQNNIPLLGNATMTFNLSNQNYSFLTPHSGYNFLPLSIVCTEMP